MSESPTLPDANNCLHANYLNFFRKEGYVVLEHVFEPEFIQQLHDHFIRGYQHYFANEEHKDALRVGSGRYQITVEVEGPFNTPRLYANDLVLGMMSELLGKDFIVSDLTCVASLPGSEIMHVHSDGTIFNGLPIANLLPAHAVGLLIPLVHFDQTNGVTRLWPGTHRTSTPNASFENNRDFVDPELQIGTCILMDYRLKHRGMPNRSNQVRPLLYCNYAVPWYFDSNNFKKQAHLKITDKNFETVPEQYKRLFARRNMKLA